eukprot:5248720-Alexandrium_andersonii.AAC.1
MAFSDRFAALGTLTSMRLGHRAGSLSSLTRARPSSACRISGSARSWTAGVSPPVGSRSSWPSWNAGS